MKRRTTSRFVGTAALAFLAAGAAPCLAQQDVNITVPQGPAYRPWSVVELPDPDTPDAERARAERKTVAELERELKKLRARYFGHMRNVEIRQAGIAKLREYTDPVIYPSLLELFRSEKDDVREAVLDLLLNQQNDQADAAIAWVAVFERDKDFRKLAVPRLKSRVARTGGASDRISRILNAGLKNDSERVVAGTADLIAQMKLYEFLPKLIAAQSQRQRTDDRQGALATFYVANQRAYVSDLTPVVGTSAVGFDPTVSVLTEGTVLQINGAHVVTYRTEVHYALMALAQSGLAGAVGPGGAPAVVPELNFDHDAWMDWYANEFLPTRKRIDAENAAKENLCQGVTGPTGAPDQDGLG